MSEVNWNRVEPIRELIESQGEPFSERVAQFIRKYAWRQRRMFEREGLYLYPLNHEKAYWVAVKGPRTIREVQDG